jgi:hypothetical protein
MENNNNIPIIALAGTGVSAMIAYATYKQF